MLKKLLITTLAILLTTSVSHSYCEKLKSSDGGKTYECDNSSN